MFVIVSKKKAAAAPSSCSSAAATSSRTQNACDPCRVRKSKVRPPLVTRAQDTPALCVGGQARAYQADRQCDGHTPCGRCVAKQLVCTSSRRVAKATGPVTEEHVAILQEQQKRLTRAISTMADVIKRVESRGSSVGDSCTAAADLSPFELEDVLQRFAPESKTAATTSPADEPGLPSSKKRRFHETALPTHPTEDVPMDDSSLAQLPETEGYEQFQKFLTTIQQHGSNRLNPTADSFQPALTGFEAPSSQPQLTADLPSTPDAFAAGSSSGPGPQLAPFMDMIDWNASLHYFLSDQNNGDPFDWDSMNPDPGLQNGAAWEHELQE